MKTFLGIDGGGSKTAFILIDETGHLLASHSEGPAYYLEIGWGAMQSMLAQGIEATVSKAGRHVADVDYAFLGLPAYGEDTALLPKLDAAASPTLQSDQYRCGNDAMCAWAGALACEDGINVLAGTGAMAYGEYRGRTARAGGWGELFSDEGSAYWVAREGLTLFSRMSDGRAPRGPLYEMVRGHFRLASDLDLCAAIYGQSRIERSSLAALAPLIAEAANAGDTAAAAVFARAVDELVQLIHAVHGQLRVPEGEAVAVSFSGGMFLQKNLLRLPLRTKLAESGAKYRLVPPRFPPAAGAALYAAKLNGSALTAEAIRNFENELLR